MSGYKETCALTIIYIYIKHECIKVKINFVFHLLFLELNQKHTPLIFTMLVAEKHYYLGFFLCLFPHNCKIDLIGALCNNLCPNSILF